MQENSSRGKIAQIIRVYKDILENLREKSVISGDILADYKKIVDNNVHSMLQWALIRAGNALGLNSLPEFKVKLKEPLDPRDYGLKGKRRHKIKVDIAFLKNLELIGIGEVFTIDEAHECYETLYTEDFNWITARTRISHILKYGKFNEKRRPFVILVVILPKKARRKPPWPAQKVFLKDSNDYYEKFAGKWKEFIEEIRKKGFPASLVILTEEEVEIY